MNKILITGFNAFGNLSINPSQAIVEEIARRKRDFKNLQIHTEVLKTEFKAAEERMKVLINDFNPDIILCLGVSAADNTLRLERVALNIDDTDDPDNFGYRPSGAKILADAPLAYFSNFELKSLCGLLNQNRIPAKISNHAGTYVCNHVFYIAAHEAGKMNPQCKFGFLHIPLPSEYMAINEREKPLSYLEILNGVKFIIQYLGNSIKTERELT